MEYRHQIIFNEGTPQETLWNIFVDYKPNLQYIAAVHCLTRTEPCWVETGYATSDLALTSMNNHVVNYIRNLPNATFKVECHPEESNLIVLSVTCTSTTWNIQVVSGTASPQNGTGRNYNETVLNCWNAIMTY